MNHIQTFNSLNFIAGAGYVIIAVAVFLLLMSVASWYLMFIKTIQNRQIKNSIQRYVTSFWTAPNLQAALKIDARNSPAYELAHNAAMASQHYQTHVGKSQDSACSHEEFVARSMRRSMAQTSERLESGLSVLASVGSVSPFVGLFGTVWGIYHALAAIGVSGQATLDKVAGPVGEALIMTAIGLAVAIPAVLAYNAFVKSNRNITNQLDQLAQDLHVLITTGTVLIKKKVEKSKTAVKARNTSPVNARGVAA